MLYRLNRRLKLFQNLLDRQATLLSIHEGESVHDPGVLEVRQLPEVGASVDISQIDL